MRGSYDFQQTISDPEAFIRMVVYGKPKPMLEHRQRWTPDVTLKLWAALAHSPAVLLKCCSSKEIAEQFAVKVRHTYLKDTRYVVVVKDMDVLIYNSLDEVPEDPPYWNEIPDPWKWCDVEGAAQILGVCEQQVRNIAKANSVRFREIASGGGKPRKLYDRAHIQELRRRKNQHKKTRRKTKTWL